MTHDKEDQLITMHDKKQSQIIQ